MPNTRKAKVKFPLNYGIRRGCRVPSAKVLSSRAEFRPVSSPGTHATPAQVRQFRTEVVAARFCHAFHGVTVELHPSRYNNSLGHDPISLLRWIINDPRLNDLAEAEALLEHLRSQLEADGFDVSPINCKTSAGIYRCIRDADVGMLRALVSAIAQTDYKLDESAIPTTDAHAGYLLLHVEAEGAEDLKKAA